MYTISVVLTTYNGQKYLKEQLDSLLSQTVLPDEIIIADDLSTDETWSIIQEYCKQYPNLFVAYRNSTRLGPNKNFKEAFKKSRCELIAPCDQDDIWLSNKIENGLNTFLANKNGMELVFCQDIILYEDSSTELTNRFCLPLLESLFRSNLYGHDCLFKRDMIHVYEKVPLLSYDTTLWILATLRNSIIALDSADCIWRRHATVCTTAWSAHSLFSIEPISSRVKTCRALFLLLKKNIKSDSIRVQMVQIAKIIEYHYPDAKQEDRRLLSDCYEICSNLSRQTFLSMIMSGAHAMRIVCRETGRGVNHLKRMMWAFRLPFCYWYDLHNEKYL